MNRRLEDEENVISPMSPCGEYLTSSVLSLYIIAVLELKGPNIVDYSKILSVLNDVFLPINPRFSSIIVEQVKGVKKWKKVEVKFNDHVIIPKFPQEKSLDLYDEYLNEYISRIAMDPLPQTQPLWEIHLMKHPTNTSNANLIFKLHHALGDGYSLMGLLLSCLKRADDPSLSLTFPSTRSNSRPSSNGGGRGLGFNRLSRLFLGLYNTSVDFGWSVLKSSVMKDDITPIRSGDSGVEFRPVTITTMQFSVDHIKQITAKLRVTVNDVISGAILFGIRKYMEGENENSRKAKSTALVLLNTRSLGGYQSVSEMLKPNSKTPWGNHFAFLHISIPKLLNKSSNPIDFVLKTHKMVKKKRNSAAVYLTARLLETLRKFKGPEASAKYIHKTITNSSLGITNLIGPLEYGAIANHTVESMYFTVTGPPESIVISILSYVGTLRITFAMEKGFVDSEKFKSCIQNSFDTMFKDALQFPCVSHGSVGVVVLIVVIECDDDGDNSGVCDGGNNDDGNCHGCCNGGDNVNDGGDGNDSSVCHGCCNGDDNSWLL